MVYIPSQFATLEDDVASFFQVICVFYFVLLFSVLFFSWMVALLILVLCCAVLRYVVLCCLALYSLLVDRHCLADGRIRWILVQRANRKVPLFCALQVPI